MSFKPDEKDWMAYLYGELEGQEKEKMDEYLLSSAEARQQYERFQNLRQLMSSVDDKEVIAPPIIIEGTKQRFLWNTPYFRTIASIAASLLLIILMGKATGIRMSASNGEFRLGFGESKTTTPPKEDVVPSMTTEEVQQMINASLQANNNALQSNWDASQKKLLDETQKKLNASIKENLVATSTKIDEVLKLAATASQEQIAAYVSTIQTDNEQRMKNYFDLTSTQQKKYIEDLVVDFAQYLQQQRNNDLQLVQNKLLSIEQNTTTFQQQTEQILTSIIGSVGPNGDKKETRN